MSEQFKVAIIGDFMEDVYWIGESNSLSAEVPIPVVKIKEIKAFPGGAGNVAMNLANLGCKTLWFSGGGTPVKNRLMVGDHQVARWDQFDFCTPAMGLNRLKDVDAIVVSDYGKGTIDSFTVESIKRYLRDVAAVPLFVDTKSDPSIWSGVATAVFPNEKEALQFSLEYARFNGIVVRKRGSKGLDLSLAGSAELITSPAQAQFIRSVNGAGDTVIAAFVQAWLSFGENRNYQAMLDWANTAAAIAVENPYTYAPTYEEVLQRYEDSN